MSGTFHYLLSDVDRELGSALVPSKLAAQLIEVLRADVTPTKIADVS